ncbi:MAG: signal recognition particle protein, partial [Bacteroidales bacterium]|nr:signal recognition particle protein [Bacteroidales bacterium]
KKLGGLSSILGMMPGINSSQMAQIEGAVDDKKLAHIEAIILSMTPAERENPDIINGSRRKRIADGSGTSVAEVNRILKQFEETKKAMHYMYANKGKRFGRR